MTVSPTARWGVELPGGVSPREFDYFHGLVGGA